MLSIVWRCIAWRRLCLGLSVAIVALASSNALALILPVMGPTSYYWIGGSSNWSTIGNWSTVGPFGSSSGTIPGANSIVYLTTPDSDSASGVTITYNYSGAPITLGTLYINNATASGQTPVATTLLLPSGTLSSGFEYVGDLGGAGTNSGAITQTGGTNNATDLYLGFAEADVGSYSLQGGALNATAEGIGCSANAIGTFTQSGGTNTASSVTVGVDADDNGGGNGSYTITSGTLTANTGLTISAPGNSGVASTFAQSGGTVNAGALLVNYNSVTTYTLNSGPLRVSTSEQILGTFNQNGGSNTLSGGNLTVDSGGNGSQETGGSYTLIVPGTAAPNNSASLSVSGNEYIGNSYDGYFTQGGVSTNTVTSALVLGQNADSFGSYELTDSAQLTVGGAETIGSSGVGTFTENGGSNSVTGNLTIASSGSASGSSYSLNTGGSLSVGGTLTVNTGGTFNVSTGTTLSYGSFTLAGGTINGTLTNATTFVYQSGSFTGSLVNNGTSNIQLTNGNSLTIGVAANNSSVTLNPGSALNLAAATSGTGIGSLVIVPSSLSATGLTIGGASGAAPVLTFNIGGSGASDLIKVPGNVSVGNTGGVIDIAVPAGAGIMSPGNYTLIAANGGLGSGFTLGNLNQVLTTGIGAYIPSLSASTSKAEILTLTAAPLYWISGNNNWSNGNYWSLNPPPNNQPAGAYPGQGTETYITDSDSVSRTVNYDYTGTPVTLGSLNIDNTSGTGATNTLQMSGGTITVNTTTIGAGGIISGYGTVGNTADLNNMNLINANNTSGQPLTIQGPSSVQNTGTMESTGGAVLFLNDLMIANSTGAISANGGTTTLVSTNVNNQGGIVEAVNGTLSHPSILYINSSTISGGAVSTDTGNSAVVLNGTLPELNGQTNGGLTLSGDIVPDTTVVIAGTITNNTNLSDATDPVTGLTLPALNLEIGDGAGNTSATLNGTGSVNMMRSGALITGYSSNDSLINNSSINGLVTISNLNMTNNGAINANSIAFTLQNGVNLTSAGTITASAGEIVAATGVATLSQTSGSNQITSGNLTVGDQATANGTYNLVQPGTGGGSATLTVAGTETIGAAGTGFFTQGGTSTNTITANFGLELGELPNSSGTYTLAENASLNSSGVEIIGNGGAGYFTQSGGNNIAQGDIDLGGDPSGSGTYTLNGGVTNVSGSVYVGGSASGAGGSGNAIINTSGVLTVGSTLDIYPGNVVSLESGGTINTEALNTNGTPSVLNWLAGTLNITNNVTWDSAASPTSTSDAFGASLAIGANQTLQINGNEGIGGAGSFSLTLNSGATHAVTGNITVNPSGALTVNSGSTLSYPTLTLAGGTINGTLTNATTFVYQSGSFTGSLFNSGTSNIQLTNGNSLNIGVTANNSSVTLNPGSALNLAAATSGTGIGSLVITPSSVSATGLTIGGASGAAPVLSFNIGSSGASDLINVLGNVSVGNTGGVIDITLPAGAGITGPGNYTLMTANGGLGGVGAGGFTLGNPTQVLTTGIGAYTPSLSASTSKAEILTLTAAPLYWISGNNNWSNGNYWSVIPPPNNQPAGAYPGQGTETYITDSDGVSRTVNYDYTGTPVTLGSLNIDNTSETGATNTLQMSSAGTLTATTVNIGAHGIIQGSGTIQGAALTNYGTIAGSDPSGTLTLQNLSSLTNNSGGKIEPQSSGWLGFNLNASNVSNSGLIEAGASPSTTRNFGGGSAGTISNTSITNSGTIQAIGDGELTIQNSTSITNSGTMGATASQFAQSQGPQTAQGSELTLTNLTVNNQNGVISATGGLETSIPSNFYVPSIVAINSSIVLGGTVSTDNSYSAVELQGNAELNGYSSQGSVTLSGNILPDSASGALIAGTIINNGSINDPIGNNNSTAYGEPPMNLKIGDGSGAPGSTSADLQTTGTGNVTMDQSGSMISGYASTDTLINDTGHTIEGEGTIENLKLIDNGIIDANTPGKTLLITTNITDDSTGTLEATNGGELNLTNLTVTGSGKILAGAGSKIVITNSSVTASNLTVHGNAIIDPSTVEVGELDLESDGSLALSAGDQLIIDSELTDNSLPGNFITAGADLEFSGNSAHTLSTSNDLSFANLTLLNSGGSLVASGSGSLNFGEIILPDENPSDIGSQLQSSLPITYNPTDPANVYLLDATYTLPGGGSLTPGVIAASLVWNNAGANGINDGRTWDIANNINWNNGVSAVYANGANVIFNDNNNLNYNVTLNAPVSPASVTVNNSNGNYTISGTGGIGGTGSLTKSGTGILTFSTANTYSGGTFVTAGMLLIGQAGNNATFDGSGNLETPNTFTALPNGALSISGSGIVRLADGVTNQTFVTPGVHSALVTSNITLTSLSLIGNGTLDIGDNRILIDYGSGPDPIASIEQWIANGYYGLPGPSIISSDIATDDALTGFSYGIGYADGADGLIAGLPSGEIEIMYTLLGDANLDGTVNAEDFTPFSHNLGESGMMWDDGDFNYDGTVNAEDFTPFSHNLGQSVGIYGASETGSLNSLLAVLNGISIANVPEPVSVGMMMVAGLGILSRRPRSSRHCHRPILIRRKSSQGPRAIRDDQAGAGGALSPGRGIRLTGGRATQPYTWELQPRGR